MENYFKESNVLSKIILVKQVPKNGLIVISKFSYLSRKNNGTCLINTVNIGL